MLKIKFFSDLKVVTEVYSNNSAEIKPDSYIQLNDQIYWINNIKMQIQQGIPVLIVDISPRNSSHL